MALQFFSTLLCVAMLLASHNVHAQDDGKMAAMPNKKPIVEKNKTATEKSEEAVPEEGADDVVVKKPISAIGSMKKVTAKYEDTLVHMARAHNLGFIEIRAANPHLDPWIPGEGAEVILPQMHILPDAQRKGVVINLPEMRLYYYQDPAQDPISLPIGVGREGLATPMGKTTVVRKKAAPTWRPTQRMRDEDPELPAVVEAGPENPLGDYALYLGWPTYLIHGTNKPYGIGRRVSSGCIRMYPEGIEKLFSRVPVGTQVNVINQPIKTAWVDDTLYLEAHVDLEDALTMEKDGVLPDYDVDEQDIADIMEVAGEDAQDIDWDIIKNTLRKRQGYPVEIARRAPGHSSDDETKPASSSEE